MWQRKSAPSVNRIECNLLEVKFSGAESEMTFSGYGAVFGNVDSYGDVIQKGAFTDTIREAKATGSWPAMLLQHGGMQLTAEDMTPIGVWTNLSEDSNGLLVEGKLAPTARGQEIHALMKMTPRPAINGLSIGYVPISWKMRSNPTEPRRTLEAVKLIEISPVTFPANVKARIQSAKSDLTIRQAEQALRDVGFSQAEAKAILASGFKALPQRDVDGLAEIAALLQSNLNLMK